MTSYFQDGGYNVISHIKVLPSAECTRSVCSAHIQQRPLVQIHSTIIVLIILRFFTWLSFSPLILE